MFDVLTTLDLHQLLLIGHLVALLMGLGVILSIEFLLLRSLLGDRVTTELVQRVQHSTQLLIFGLALSWVTVLGFLLHQQTMMAELAIHAKTCAKICVMVVLTLNIVVSLKVVSPILRKYRGRDLLANATQNETLFLAGSAAVSLVSWSFPLLLSLYPTLNNGDSVVSLLGQYFLCSTFAIVIACAIVLKLRDHRRLVSMLSYHGKAVA
ncbi:MAG: hypothetical protein ACPGSC_11200 [Granulosicoccaceae bacterium]